MVGESLEQKAFMVHVSAHIFSGENHSNAQRNFTPVLRPAHRRRALKVSQARMSPLSKPRRNQRTRCSEVPWVKLSGTT